MKFPEFLRVRGDIAYRGICPLEDAELATFFNELRSRYPAVALAATHVANEGKRTPQQARKAKAMGMKKGFADIIIAGAPALVIEMKRQDHTKSRWQDGQIEALEAAQKLGAFVCVALGWRAAMLAVEEWLACVPTS